ncbi:MAG TPA: radical SAM protein, partial [Candidatus Omnitrophica bacterium]|nr:radical SAM protein [Candidatus Omnitrophota bacterium]
MRILLIQPPIRDFFFTPLRKTPLGLLYLATFLEKEGFSVKVLNALEEDKKYTLRVPKKFLYLKRYYRKNKSPF